MSDSRSALTETIAARIAYSRARRDSSGEAATFVLAALSKPEARALLVAWLQEQGVLKRVGDTRPHRFPAIDREAEVISWKCAECGEWQGLGSPKTECPFDWREPVFRVVLDKEGAES